MADILISQAAASQEDGDDDATAAVIPIVSEQGATAAASSSAAEEALVAIPAKGPSHGVCPLSPYLPPAAVVPANTSHKHTQLPPHTQLKFTSSQ